tara:strand:+ start:344 stop:1078 length:735 start_codon:yes stop_codon:yes gene_type:complete
MINPVRICLWSGPRNISTALMYSFAQRPGCKVFDEPLYAHYLRNVSEENKKRHPESNVILETMENDGAKVVDFMLGDFPKGTTAVFFKNMTHHILDLDISFMKDVVNVILTRHPEDMLPSFNKVIESPSISDVGYAAQTELIAKLENIGAHFVVVESRAILENPIRELSRICDAAGLPFDETMLSWEKGPREEDGVWAPHWYTRTHNSTGFQKYSPKKAVFPERLRPLLEECLPYFEKIITYSL